MLGSRFVWPLPRGDGILLLVIDMIFPEHSYDWLGTMPSGVSINGAENDRGPTVEELQRELAEAREQQFATSAIVHAISNAPSDAQAAFQKIAASAARLCDAYDAGVLQRADDHLVS
jgi:hypothetical protein